MTVESIVDRIAGHPAALVDFAHGSVAVSLYQVARIEDLVDRESLLRDDFVPEPPYWAHLWIGARALGRALAESDELRGQRVLDLGCGLGRSHRKDVFPLADPRVVDEEVEPLPA